MPDGPRQAALRNDHPIPTAEAFAAFSARPADSDPGTPHLAGSVAPPSRRSRSPVGSTRPAAALKDESYVATGIAASDGG
jgi:hypothetical protein